MLLTVLYFSVIGRLMVRLTYADALSNEEEDNIISKNDEAVKLSTESSTKIYLVNFFPSRTSDFPPPCHLLSSLTRTLSQVHSSMVSRCRVPAFGSLYSYLDHICEICALGKGLTGLCEFFVIITHLPAAQRDRRILESVDRALPTSWSNNSAQRRRYEI